MTLNGANLKGDFTQDDSQRRFLAQLNVGLLEQCCDHSKQCRNNVATIRNNVATMLQRCVTLKIVVATQCNTALRCWNNVATIRNNVATML